MSASHKVRKLKTPTPLVSKLPLFTEQDAISSLQLLEKCQYHTRYRIDENIAVTFYDACHILGSATIYLELGQGTSKRTVFFSGNVGRTPEPVSGADYLMLESTYGDRLHPTEDRRLVLAEKLLTADQRALKPDKKFGHGVIAIPCFSVDRAQQLLFDLRHLMTAGLIPTRKVVLDSPMAIAVTDVYRKYPQYLSPAMQELIKQQLDPFQTPGMIKAVNFDQSLLEAQSEPLYVIAGGGMANGGRILNHLHARLPGKQNTVLFVGYQGAGLLGHQLVALRDAAKGGKDAPTVKVLGEAKRVNATIDFMPHFSAHIDSAQTIGWLEKMTVKPRKVFLVHGDAKALVALKEKIEARFSWQVVVAKTGETYTL
jgi:metallo-beta-lactamase family protein